jgi:hypothetical protein
MRPPFLPSTRPLRLRARPARGAALLLMLVVAVVILSSYLLTLPATLIGTLDRDRQDNLTLQQSKLALRTFFIRSSYARSSGTAKSLGYLPAPDVLANNAGDPTEPNYDGAREQGCAGPNHMPGGALKAFPSDRDMRCFGRLPWRHLGLDLLGVVGSLADLRADVQGRLPYYAVAAALVEESCPFVIDSRIKTAIYRAPPLGCDVLYAQQSRLAYPWISVFGSDGKLKSNRVAFVVIVPGDALPGQTRSTSPIQPPWQYLEGFRMTSCDPRPYSPEFPVPPPPLPVNWPTTFWGGPAGCIFHNSAAPPGGMPPNTADGNRLGMAFVECPARGEIAPSDSRYVHPVQCNDKLVYATIDELVDYAKTRKFVD